MALALGNWSALASMPGMDDAEFARWADLLEKRTGVVVPPSRKAFLVTSVRGRMRETGHMAFGDYYRDLQKGAEGAIEWTTLVDRLTVHETHFFRHPPSFDLIANEWLPKVAKPGTQGALHAWSVGCSTGEEAYTLAMVLDSHLGASAGSKMYFGVTATDVSQPALSVGRAALYPRSKLEEIPASLRERYVDEIDADSFGVNESLRKRVGFAQFNLLDVARAPLKRLDLIYCQNVLIYFARERRRDLLVALAGLLKPGGLLVLGPGEVTQFALPQLSRVPSKQALAFLRNP
jgi:chemotaxis methyl-accepting protein methylase